MWGPSQFTTESTEGEKRESTEEGRGREEEGKEKERKKGKGKGKRGVGFFLRVL
jgi:hypothetical protein